MYGTSRITDLIAKTGIECCAIVITTICGIEIPIVALFIRFGRNAVTTKQGYAVGRCTIGGADGTGGFAIRAVWTRLRPIVADPNLSSGNLGDGEASNSPRNSDAISNQPTAAIMAALSVQ